MIFLIAICHPDEGLVEARLVSPSETNNFSSIVRQVREDLPDDGQDHAYNCLSRLVEKVCTSTPKKMRVITMVHKTITYKRAPVSEYCFLLEEV